ncbi:MAG: HAD family phosphatase [Bacteroidetes bacterium]|nr:MAG: HAD family phosphatase [Bacteroidota bacterium]
MIQLFVSDIDGCLAEPYHPYDLVAFQDLARRVAEAEAGTGRPRFTLCSGRAYAYVEAVCQALGVRVPALFEAGAGLFDPVAARVSWHPAFTDEMARNLRAIRDWLDEAIRGTRLMPDLGKRTQAGIIGADRAEVARLVPVVEQYVRAHYDGFEVLHTPFSIDVVPAVLTKAQGMAWLADYTGVPLSAIAYIGDSNGDIGALRRVGRSYAPANGAPEVKAIVDRVTEGALIAGVLEAYDACTGAYEAPGHGYVP